MEAFCQHAYVNLSCILSTACCRILHASKILSPQVAIACQYILAEWQLFIPHFLLISLLSLILIEYLTAWCLYVNAYVSKPLQGMTIFFLMLIKVSSMSNCRIK